MRVKVSQEILAEMVGTTRPRVNYFMNKFRKLGFIEYNGGIQINEALLERRPPRVGARPPIRRFAPLACCCAFRP